MDLFNTNNGTPAPAAAPQSSSASADLFGGMGSPPPTVASPPPTAGPPLFDAYNTTGLHIAFHTRRDASAVQIMARFRNTSGNVQFSSVSLQAAVPKSQRLQLQAISSSDLPPGATASQQMRVQSVNGPPPAKLRLRLKVGYATGGGAPIVEQVDWTEPT